MRRTDFPAVSLDDWRRRVRAELDGAEPETLVGRTIDGLDLEPLYCEASRDDIVDSTPVASGAPQLCPRIEAVGPEAVAAEIAEHRAGGADGVWLGDVARLGLGSGAELAAAFEADRLAGSEVRLDAGPEPRPWLTAWTEWLEANRLDPEAVSLHLSADPLGTLAGRGAVPRPIDELLDEMGRTAGSVAERLPGATAAMVSTVSYQEAGADLATELGFAVATALDYVGAAAEHAIAAADFLDRMSVRFAVGCQIFPEIAKLRAFRLLWRALAGALELDRLPSLDLHVVGSRRTYSRREPQINMLRATQQGVIACLGGATAVSLPAHDGLGAAPSERGRRLARAIPLVLAHEGRLDRVADPAAGAYMVEAATRQLARRGWELALQIDRRGGMTEELLSGDAAERVAASWRERRDAYESGAAGLTGVTEFVDEDAVVLPSSAADAGAPEGGGKRIEPFVLRRDAAAYERSTSERGGGE